MTEPTPAQIEAAQRALDAYRAVQRWDARDTALRALIQGLRDDVDSGAWAERNDASKRAEHALRAFCDSALATLLGDTK